MSQLLPERAPAWLKPALGVDPSQVQELIGNRQASSLNGTNIQVPVKREAAVLMLLSGKSSEDGSILLTHRSPSMRSHSGQIAFPGGRRDPADTSLVDTAQLGHPAGAVGSVAYSRHRQPRKPNSGALDPARGGLSRQPR